MPGAAVDQVPAAGDDAGLGAAEQLVAREGDEGGAVREGLAGGRLTDQPGRRAAGQPRRGRVEQAGPDVGDDRRAEAGQLASTATVSVKPTMR